MARSAKNDPLARLRAICLALPEAQEKLSHGEPTWFAGKGKVFAMLDNHHHGAAHLERPDGGVVTWLVEQAYRLVAHRRLVALLPPEKKTTGRKLHPR